MKLTAAPAPAVRPRRVLSDLADPDARVAARRALADAKPGAVEPLKVSAFNSSI